MAKKYAIVVAGGSGQRMGGDMPKQFMSLNQTPILVHTLRKFLQIKDLEVILVLPEFYFSHWEDIKSVYFTIENKIHVVAGGASRFQSVKNGLNRVIETEDCYVAIHDAVRPFISTEKISVAFDTAYEKGNAILAVPSKDSIRMKKGEASEALPRETIFLVQTPQIFLAKVLQKAYMQTESSDFTDDASVVEADGNSIFMVEGSYDNIKITTPEDLALAQILIEKYK